MKRTAIIIEASDVRGETPIPGAKVDAANWRNYLLSDLGGAWRNDEIHVLSKPISSQVETLIEGASDGYTFVAFSGHGEEGSVVLSEYNRSCPISTLKPQSDRGTLILDSCRGVSEARSINFSSSGQKIATFSDIANSEKLIAMNESVRALSSGAQVGVNHRALWCAFLKKACVGKVLMQSCARGGEAGEDPNAGGYYTQLLLDSAEKWSRRGRPYTQHTTKEAHGYASALLAQRKQHPEYSPESIEFPFAVKLS